MKLSRGFCSLLFCFSLCGLLVACQSDSPEPEPEVSCYERWLDDAGKSHCGHAIQFKRRIVDRLPVGGSDTAATGQKVNVVGQQYYCATDSVAFLIPTTPVVIAK